MLRTFNCGIGMILIVGLQDVERVLKHLGEEARVIGAIGERGRGAAVRYEGAAAWSVT
jgi:phosphoribosylaminoimidazole (AIR) synthetase